ncbi:MAG: hypothetical protein F9K23_12670 [Bacteroidetes bacterium]|nr:MAG: hypothetical protein F9K23_12670 [Bacteroidota bacterium]
MNSNFTTNDLLLFLYGEMNADKAAVLTEQLITDVALRAEFQKLKETKERLDAEQFEPDATTINMVMDYSASYHSAPEHHAE